MHIQSQENLRLKIGHVQFNARSLQFLISFILSIITLRPSHKIYNLMKLFVAAICLLALLCSSKQISATGTVTVNANPYQAAVFVPKIENSYVVLDFNAIKYNMDMKLTTSISRSASSDTQDKLTITSNIVGAGGLNYQLVLQYLVLVEFDNYEFTYVNMTSDINYLSTKKLLYNSTGSVIPYVFFNGFSNTVIVQCVQVSGNVGTFTYPLSIAVGGGCPAQGAQWVTFYLMLMKSPLIPECNNSLADFRQSTTNWTVQKQPGFQYFFGFSGIYSINFLGKAHLDTNIFEVEPGGDFDLSMVGIDTNCFKAIKYPDTGLQAWQIALIVVGCVLFLALIGVIVFLVIRAKRQKQESEEALRNGGYEMSGAALGIPQSLNPITIKIGKHDIVPEEKKEWTKEEIDQKFGSS